MSASETVKLRLHSGVPIVDVLGEWAPSVAEALGSMTAALIRAGHYDLVVNVQRAALTGATALTSFTQIAKAVRSHCGHIDVVGTAEQIDQMLRHQTERLYRLAVCEETAIGHIKRMPILSSGSRYTARPV